MPSKSSASPTLPASIPASLDIAVTDELAQLKKRVEERALELAQKRADDGISAGVAGQTGNVPVPVVQIGDISVALDEALGKRIPPEPKTSFFDLFPPFTCLCFLLCLIFGFFGLRSADKNNGFLDIAKIFAGALVGSTTTSMANVIRTKRAR